MPYTAAERQVRARLGAFAQHAQYDVRQTTAAARSAFLERFDREVDPDGTLSPSERQRRAQAARKAYFQRLTLQRLSARSAKKRQKQTAELGVPAVADESAEERVDAGNHPTAS